MTGPFLLAIGVGGGLVSVMRYLLSSGVTEFADVAFPVGTLAVNVLGSFIMGVLAGSTGLFWLPGPEVRAFYMVGLLGGFTTFSSFSLDAAMLVEQGNYMAAAWYLIASPVMSVIGLFTGLYGVRALFN